jgi:hypothetical protein
VSTGRIKQTISDEKKEIRFDINLVKILPKVIQIRVVSFLDQNDYKNFKATAKQFYGNVDLGYRFKFADPCFEIMVSPARLLAGYAYGLGLGAYGGNKYCCNCGVKPCCICGTLILCGPLAYIDYKVVGPLTYACCFGVGATIDLCRLRSYDSQAFFFLSPGQARKLKSEQKAAPVIEKMEDESNEVDLPNPSKNKW